MRITALEVDGFGVWTGLKLDPLADGLNVFYGPNEAGKSTLMQFVRSVLYGFSPERRRYFPPVHGGRPGGSLEIVGPNGRHRISRYTCPEKDNPGDELTLLGPDGARLGEHLLRGLLCNVDEPIFNNVFAVGLLELQELATLNGTEAASLLYNLSAGLDRVSLVEVMRELETSRNRLLDRSGGACQVLQLMAEREKIRAQIHELDALGRQYARIAAERDQLQREANRLEEESGQLGSQVRALEIALAVRERWQKRKSLDEQLTALGPAEKMPEGAIERLETLGAVLEERQKLAQEFKQQWDRLRREAAGLKINEPLWRQAPRIEALQEQEQWIGTLETRLLELETEIAEAETLLTEEQKRFGFADGAVPSISPRSLAALKRPAGAMRRSRQRLEELQQQVKTNQEVAETLSEQVESALDSRGEKHLAEAAERVGALVGQLRRRVQIDERLEQMDRHLAELDEQSQTLLDKQMLPITALLGLGALFVVGAAMVVVSGVGMLFPSSIFGGLDGRLAFLGLALVIVAVVVKYMSERSSSRRMDQCHRNISMLQLQMKQAREERTNLDRQLPKGEGPLVARLQAAERDLAGLEELVPLDSRRQAAQQEAESAGARVKQAESEMSEAARRWKEAIAAAGLPKGLSPKQVKELASRSDQINQLQQRLQRLREEQEQRTAELESITGRIAQLVKETGLGSEAAGPVEQLRVLIEQLSEQEDRLKRRQSLRKEGRQLRRKRAKLEAALVKLKRRRRAWLTKLGVKDEDQFRQRAARHARVEDLRRQREALHREIEAAMAGQVAEQAIQELLEGEGAASLETRREQLQDRLEACTVQLKQRFEKRGQLNEQLRALAENRTPAQKQFELGLVEERLADALQRWKVLGMTGTILEEVRKTYEQTRQPETLQEASGHLRVMTQDRYCRVWTPLSENVLLVDDAEGNSLPVEVLSRGAREQLFLCLRLALASSYGRRGIELPLVLDDVLVNFDSQRAKAAVSVLSEFAEAGHQLLVFTCHEHIAKMFQGQHVDVHELPSHAEPHPTVAVSSKPAKPKRKRKPAAEEEPAEPIPEPKPSPAVVAKPKPAAPAQPPMEELAPWEEDDSEAADPEDAFLEEEVEEGEIPEVDEMDEGFSEEDEEDAVEEDDAEEVAEEEAEDEEDEYEEISPDLFDDEAEDEPDEEDEDGDYDDADEEEDLEDEYEEEDGNGEFGEFEEEEEDDAEDAEAA